MKIRSISGISLTMVAGLALLASSCEKKPADNEMIFDTYNYDVISELTTPVQYELDGSKYCRQTGRGVLPRAIGSYDITELRDTLLKLGGVTINEKGEAMPVAVKELKSTNLSPDSTSVCSTRFRSISIVMATPTMIVWSIFGEGINCGAAHDLYTTNYVNYSLERHAVLRLSDLMKKGYEPVLKNLLREKLSERDDLLLELKDIGIPPTFRVTPEGITFVYGVYEIAPYSSGEVEVPFHAYELMNILTPQAFKCLTGYSVE